MSHSPNNHSNNPDIDAKELLSRFDAGEQLNLLDVREPIEYYTHNIGGLNIPLGKLANGLQQLPWNNSDEIIVICQAGLRSETAQSILQENGYANIRNLTGGLLALRKLKH
jgi:rhodanese-related sulfurtransferase